MKAQLSDPAYLQCERRGVFALLMVNAGIMGAYTYELRGGVFCNAQTANLLKMGILLGKGELLQGLYYLIPFTAYALGAFLSELLPKPVRRFHLLRWDTYLVLFETAVLFLIGLLPLTIPPQIVQVAVNFLASMQYNTFRQAEGFPMATTFCTNHVRQVGLGLAQALRKKDPAPLRKSLVHLGMITCFCAGAALATVACEPLRERTIWLSLVPMGLVLLRLVHADLTEEHDLLERAPRGH